MARRAVLTRYAPESLEAFFTGWLGTLAALAGALVGARAQEPSGGEIRPYYRFLRPDYQHKLEDEVERQIDLLRDANAFQRDQAVRALISLGSLAEEPVRSIFERSGQDRERRGALRVLMALGPSAKIERNLLRMGANNLLEFDVRGLVLLELGGRCAGDARALERVQLLAEKARSSGGHFAEESAAFGLLRARGIPAPFEELGRVVLARSRAPQLKGALLLYLGREDGESAAVIRKILARRPIEYIRACAWLGLSYRAGAIRTRDEQVQQLAMADLHHHSHVLARCAALALIPTSPGEVTALAEVLRRDEIALDVRAALLQALALSHEKSVGALLLQLVDPYAADHRREFLAAAVRRGSYALLEAIAKHPAVTREERARDFAALCALRCFARTAAGLVCRDPGDLRRARALLDLARSHLLEGERTGAPQAALALVLHGRELPSEIEQRLSTEPDLRLIARLARGMRAKTLDPRIVRRVGIVLAMHHEIDPECFRDRLIWHLAVIGLGGRSQAFRDLEILAENERGVADPSDITLPRHAPLPPTPGDGDYLKDLVFWLRARPFRTTLLDYLEGRGSF